MMRESLRRLPNLNWSRNEETALDIDPSLIQFKKFLLNEGYRQSTIDGYVNAARIYLTYTQSINPSVEEAFKFREFLIQRNKKGSTINNYCFAIKLYHRMNGEKFKFSVLKRNNQLPYFFAEEDIVKILSVCNNAKHYAMLTLGFFMECSELQNFVH
jgi:hypothetical protein